MARILSLAEAVAENVRDGDTVAMEGFTHLIPYAAGHEVIRQDRKDLFLVRMTPDILYAAVFVVECDVCCVSVFFASSRCHVTSWWPSWRQFVSP